MKKLLILAVLVTGIFFFGCSDLVTNNSSQPVSSGKQFVKLPSKAGLSKESSLSTSESVNGSRGDVIFLRGTYTTENGDQVSMFANLMIPRGAFEGTVDISMSADDEYAGVDFAPHMTFNKPLTLTLAFSGLNLKELGITRENAGFYFVDESGNLVEVPNRGISLNYQTGTIMVIGAKIDHFSRYAFAK